MSAVLWLMIPLTVGVGTSLWAVCAGRSRSRSFSDLERYQGYQAALARMSPDRS